MRTDTARFLAGDITVALRTDHIACAVPPPPEIFIGVYDRNRRTGLRSRFEQDLIALQPFRSSEARVARAIDQRPVCFSRLRIYGRQINACDRDRRNLADDRAAQAERRRRPVAASE